MYNCGSSHACYDKRRKFPLLKLVLVPTMDPNKPLGFANNADGSLKDADQISWSDPDDKERVEHGCLHGLDNVSKDTELLAPLDICSISSVNSNSSIAISHPATPPTYPACNIGPPAATVASRQCSKSPKSIVRP
jgi:hypothetical protein